MAGVTPVFTVKGYRVLKEFKDFIAKGNVIDLAVAVIIAGAFGAIVASLTDEIIMPVVGATFRREPTSPAISFS